MRKDTVVGDEKCMRETFTSELPDRVEKVA